MIPFIKTFESLVKARLWGLMAASAALAVIVVTVLIGGVIGLTALLVNVENEIIDTLVNLGAGTAASIIGWFMLPAFVVLISGMFQESVIKKVELIYYPDAVDNNDVKFWMDLKHNIKFTFWALFLNLLVIPFYFVGIGFIISVLLNSYLLGREFFESAAGYHLGKTEAKNLGSKNRMIVYGGGFFITLFTLVPFINLFIPIVATVWMVHLYHHIQKSQ